MGVPWFFSAAISAVSFFILTNLFILIQSIYAPAIGTQLAVRASIVISLLISSTEAFTLARTGKTAALVVAWLMMAPTIVLTSI